MKERPNQVALVVKPRKVEAVKWLPIIAVSLSDRMAVLERTGETVPLSDLPALVGTEPSSIWACANVAWLINDLDEVLDSNPRWQYRAGPYRRDVVSMRTVHQYRKTKLTGTIVNYFGFTSEHRKKRGHWHYPLDPVVFMSDLALDTTHAVDLLAWAQDVRAWCQANSLKIAPTAGGIAGQLLRDPRFYPQARRKVPRATNARARHVLPGNYYRLYADTSEVVSATYLDMAAAHHNAAVDTIFPHANGLYARGRFRNTDPTDTTVPEGEPWKARGSAGYKTLLTRAHGLLLLRLSVPPLPPARFPLPVLESPGGRLAWVYTNELGYLSELGVSIDGIEAAWVSFKPDPGLGLYAQFALTEIATAEPARKAWLKATLLAGYGILAATPRVQEFGYKRGKGVTRHYPAGKGRLTVKAHIGLTEQEMVTVNVIHRGMIEAETRLRSLRMAAMLQASGLRVLSIYADAVMVESGRPLPLLPPLWSVKAELTRLRFLYPTAFHSHELTKLPGVPRDGLERVRRIEDARRMQ